MPVEKRDISFYLPEIKDILIDNSGFFKSFIPRDLADATLLWAWTSRTLYRAFREKNEKMTRILKEYEVTEPVIIFGYYKKGILGRGREDVFVVPEILIKDALVAQCIKKNITIPKNFDKEVTTDDVVINLSIGIGSQEMRFEYPDALEMNAA